MSTIRVLVVEDRKPDRLYMVAFVQEVLLPIARRVYPDLFSGGDLKIDEADCAQAALESAADGQAAVDTLAVFLDLNLPNKRGDTDPAPEHGVKVLRELADGSYPVLVMSDYPDQAAEALLSRRGPFCAFRRKRTILDLMEKHKTCPDANTKEALELEAHGILAFILSSHETYNTALKIAQRQKLRDEPGDLLSFSRDVSEHVYGLSVLRPLGGTREFHKTPCSDDVGASVRDETAPLTQVIVHSPGGEVSDIPQKECSDFLVDQPLHSVTFRYQHEVFKSVLKRTAGAVLEITDLLKDVLDSSPDILRRFAWEVTRLDNAPPNTFFDLVSKPTEDIVRYAVEGVRAGGIDSPWLLRPVPNLVFTRDVGFCVHDKVFSFITAQPARMKEQLMSTFVLKHHPAFKGRFIELDLRGRSNGDDLSEEACIEGGDVVLLNKENVMIGISDRTSLKAVQIAAREILANTSVKRVFATEAPLQDVRSMHLDTYLGVVDKNLLLVYERPFKRRRQVFYEFTRDAHDPKLHLLWLADLVKSETYGMDYDDIVWVSDPQEHWEDGCNVLALAPGHIVVYKRASKTISEFVKRGWETVPADEFSTDNPPTLVPGKKSLVVLDGYELALARGGPHCMTFPVGRKEA